MILNADNFHILKIIRYHYPWLFSHFTPVVARLREIFSSSELPYSGAPLRESALKLPGGGR
eukprot:UN27623